MSLSTLITKVKYNIGSRSDKDAVITEYLNQALSDAADWADWPDLMVGGSTVTGTLTSGLWYVAQPSGSVYRKIVRIRLKDSNGNYHHIKILGKAIFRELVSEFEPNYSGIPSYAYLEGGSIYFDYKADENYTIYYDAYKYPTVMVSAGDLPSITGIDDFLVAQATGYVFASIERFDISVFWFNLAAQKIQKRIDETMGPIVDHLEPY